MTWWNRVVVAVLEGMNSWLRNLDQDQDKERYLIDPLPVVGKLYRLNHRIGLHTCVWVESNAQCGCGGTLYGMRSLSFQDVIMVSAVRIDNREGTTWYTVHAASVQGVGWFVISDRTHALTLIQPPPHDVLNNNLHPR